MALIEIARLVGFIGLIVTVMSVWGVKIATNIDSVVSCVSNFRGKSKAESDQGETCGIVNVIIAILIFIPIYLFFLYLEYYVIDLVLVKIFNTEPVTNIPSYMLYRTIDNIITAIIAGVLSLNPAIFFFNALSVFIPIILAFLVFIPILGMFLKIFELIGNNSFFQGIGIVAAVLGFGLSFL